MKRASALTLAFSLALGALPLAAQAAAPVTQPLGGRTVTYTETSREQWKVYEDDARTKFHLVANLRGDITSYNANTGVTCTSKDGHIMVTVDPKKGDVLTGIVELNAQCSAPKAPGK